MAELHALTPCDGLLPITAGGVTLSEFAPGAITALAPFAGQDRALSEALRAAHGMGFPAPNRMERAGDVRCLWTGRRQAFLMGSAPVSGLEAHAAVTDQSDAWACVTLDGIGADAVLARLVPLDLRARAFPDQAAARTLLQHMSVCVARDGDRFLILAFRSMARTLAHELGEAMASVAARTGSA